MMELLECVTLGTPLTSSRGVPRGVPHMRRLMGRVTGVVYPHVLPRGLFHGHTQYLAVG